MSLELQIGANVTPAINGAKQFNRSMEEVTLTLTEQKSVLKNLQKEYAALSTSQAQGSFGKLLASDIKVAQSEIKRLEGAATNSFGAIGAGATKAFSSIRQIAYLLPGVGVAGILGFAGSFIASLFTIGQEADKTSEKIKSLLQPLDDLKRTTGAGAEEELVKVRALSTAVLDQTKSYGERNNALNQLKEINKSYFGDLSLEEKSLGVLAQRVNEYTQAIINQAIIKEFSDQIGKVSVELSNQDKELGKAIKGVQLLGDNLKKIKSQNSGDPVGLASVNTTVVQAQTAFDAANHRLEDQTKIVTSLRQRYSDLQVEINKAVNESIQLRPLKEATEKINKDADDIVGRVKRMQAELKSLNFIIPGEVAITGFEDKATQLQKAKDFLKISAFKVEIPLDIDLPKTKDNFKDKLANPELIFGGKDILKLKIALTISDEDEKKLKAQTDSLSKTLQNAGIGVATAFGEGIASALTGGGIKGFFSDLFSAIGAGLKQLGVAIIGISPLIQSLKLALRTLSPQGILFAGVGLVAAGALIQKAASKFATGGLVFGPTLGLVGEGSGTNRSNPEVIAPLDKLKGMLGGLAQGETGLVASTELIGDKMVLQIHRVLAKQGRTGNRGGFA